MRSSSGTVSSNCPDPENTLKTVRRVLKPLACSLSGFPICSFYRALRHGRDLGRKALAYNNLLGFPYLYGYSMRTLDWLMQRMGFEHMRGFNSELLTTPFADLTSEVEREQKRVSREVGTLEYSYAKQFVTLTGPWIEVVYRMVDEDEIPRISRRLDLRFLERAVA